MYILLTFVHFLQVLFALLLSILLWKLSSLWLQLCTWGGSFFPVVGL